MVENLNRQRVLNLLDAFYAGDVDGALSYCNDDVEFLAHAPVEILPHLGHRRGKAQIGEMWHAVHTRYSSMRYEVPIILAEGDKVAVNIRVFFRKSSRDRIVQFDIADFYTLRDGRVSNILQFLDSYDLVQQVLERDLTEVVTSLHSGKA